MGLAVYGILCYQQLVSVAQNLLQKICECHPGILGMITDTAPDLCVVCCTTVPFSVSYLFLNSNLVYTNVIPDDIIFPRGFVLLFLT